MLSRVANSIYWMARYIERAENLARFVDVTLNIVLDHNRAGEQWEPLIRATGDEKVFEETYGEYNSENVRRFLTFDPGYSGSIISSINAARENARTVREAISSEAWEVLNEYYLMLRRASAKDISLANSTLYAEVKKQSHLFSGVLDSTMSRDEGWYFANVGRFLERADKTSRILDVKYFTILPSVSSVGSTVDDLLWAAVLRSVSGFEMFRKRRHTLTVEHIIDFLVLDPNFPRSIFYCIRTVAGSLSRLGGSGDPDGNPAQLGVNEIINKLSTSNNRSILDMGLHQFIDSLQVDLNEVGAELNRLYFARRRSVALQKQSQSQS